MENLLAICSSQLRAFIVYIYVYLAEFHTLGGALRFLTLRTLDDVVIALTPKSINVLWFWTQALGWVPKPNQSQSSRFSCRDMPSDHPRCVCTYILFTTCIYSYIVYSYIPNSYPSSHIVQRRELVFAWQAKTHMLLWSVIIDYTESAIHSDIAILPCWRERVCVCCCGTKPLAIAITPTQRFSRYTTWASRASYSFALVVHVYPLKLFIVVV